MKLFHLTYLFVFSCPLLASADEHIMLIATAPDHPWGSHMYEFECQLLAKCLKQFPDVDATVHMNWPDETERPKDLASIVFYSRPAGEIVLHPQRRTIFEELMRKGVGLVAIHWGTGVGYGKMGDQPEIREAYKNVLGGWFRRPPCGLTVGSSRLTQLVPDHPVCRGWQEYEIRDEFYLDLVFHEQMQPLLQVQANGKPQTVAWSFQRPSGQGRSFATTLGHFHDNFTLVQFRKMLVNGILWSAHLDPPQEGASVDVEPGDLVLPPKPDKERP